MLQSEPDRLTDGELTAEILKDAAIYGGDGTSIATVSSLQGIGFYAQAILQTSGVLGVGSKMVAMPMRSLIFVRTETGSIEARTNWTVADLKKLPVQQEDDESSAEYESPEPNAP